MDAQPRQLPARVVRCGRATRREPSAGSAPREAPSLADAAAVSRVRSAEEDSIFEDALAEFDSAGDGRWAMVRSLCCCPISLLAAAWLPLRRPLRSSPAARACAAWPRAAQAAAGSSLRLPLSVRALTLHSRMLALRRFRSLRCCPARALTPCGGASRSWRRVAGDFGAPRCCAGACGGANASAHILSPNRKKRAPLLARRTTCATSRAAACPSRTTAPRAPTRTAPHATRYAQLTRPH